jgi:uncharacterized protein (TIGR02145 family)
MSFGDKAENGLIYGRLYDFETACKVCPSGWHLPSDAEWQRLVDILGGEIWAGGKMKEAGLAHWASPNSGATNRSGFNAIGGGYRAQNDNFMGLTENGYFWSSLEFYTNNAWARDLYYGDEQIRRDYFEKTCMLSVRCIRN